MMKKALVCGMAALLMTGTVGAQSGSKGSPSNPYDWSTVAAQLNNADIAAGSYVKLRSGRIRRARASEIAWAKKEAVRPGSQRNPYNWSTVAAQLNNADIAAGSYVRLRSGKIRPVRASEIAWAKKQAAKQRAGSATAQPSVEPAVELTVEVRTAPENMVRIDAGTFTMGSPVSEPDRSDNEAPHQVTVGGFYMGKYEVTKAEYEAVMETNPNPGNFNRANLPVEQVSWFDAIDYCNRLSRREGLTEAYTVSGNGDSRTVTWNRQANGYRLPTEAEWEYACRAGTTTSFNTGNTITTDQANYNGNAAETYREQTTPVGSFAPNAWGLYDMHGNVWEWCWDRYGDYPGEARNNPEGASSGRSRVFRGGSWSRAAQFVRSAGREYDSPSYRDSTLGFRLARTL